MACSSCYNCGGSPCTTCGGYTPPPPPPPYVCPDPQPCDVAMDAECVLYTGDDLTCIGVTDPPRSVSSILVSLDQLLCQIGAGVTYVTSTNCIELDGDGTQANPLQALPRINPSLANLLQCTSAGLSTYLNTDDSDCVSLSGAGTVADPLIADVILDPDPDNLLSCGPDGLLVTGNTVEIADTNCINLSGNGSVGSPLTAAPIISSTAGNILSCTGNGLLSKLNVNTAAGCVALSGDGTSGSPLAVSLTFNSTLQCISSTLGVNPASIAITADNGLNISSPRNVQLGGTLLKNTTIDLATYKLSLLDSGAAPTGIEIIPGAAAPTNWTTANVNILSGKIYGSGLTWLTNNVGIGIQPIDSTINPATPRLNVVKTLSNGTTGGNNFTSSSNLILPSSVITLSSTNKYAGSYSTLDYRPGANITVSGAQDKFVTASFHEFIFEPAGGLGNTTSNGKVSAIAARGYFVFASDIDSFSTIRIANSVRDSGNGYTGTIDELIGLKIDDQRADSTLSGQITKTYAIKQLGDNDENRYEGPTYHINNVGIGTTPEYNYNQGARLRVFSDDYILPTTGQSSLLCSSTTMNMQIASSGLYSVGRVVSNMNTLNLAFAGAAGSVPGTQNLASGGNWSSSFTYLRFTTPRTVSGTASSNSAQCNFVSNTTFYSNCSGSGTTILCANTTGLYPGAVVTVVSGTGVFLLNTIVLTVNPTSFVVDTAPGVALVSATVQAQIAGDMGTIITYRAMSPIADVALGYDGTITNSIGVLVEQQSLISGSIGTGSITNTYGIVQGSISDITKGQSDKNIFNSEKNVFPNMVNAATDAIAAAAGVPLFGLYYIPAGVGLGGTVKIRLV